MELGTDRELNGRYNDIIVGSDTSHLLYPTTSIMQQQSSAIYTVYLPKKNNKVDVWHNNK